MFRAWGRDAATYRRESTSESLRRQLRDLPGLEPALHGRSLAALSPQELDDEDHHAVIDLLAKEYPDLLSTSRFQWQSDEPGAT